MKIYSVFTILMVILSYFNIKSGCYGDGKSEDIEFKLYSIKLDGDKYKGFIEYTKPSDNNTYREERTKDSIEKNFFYVKCDNLKYFDDLILMQYSNESVDDDNKKSYKIFDLDNFERTKNKDKDGNLWLSCEFKPVNFLDYNKDNNYNLNANVDEYFKKIKEKKISRILFINTDNFKQCKKDNTEDIKIETKNDDKASPSSTLIVKIPKRLLKDK